MFSKFQQLDQKIFSSRFSIEVYTTSKGASKKEIEMQDVEASKVFFPKNSDSTKLKQGRPNFFKILEGVQEQMQDRSNVAVLACGPAPMVDNVQADAVKMGCAFHKETFLL